MPILVGVNFRPAGRIYAFEPGDLELAPGDAVVTPTARGVELGWVKHGPREVPEDQVAQPLKRVLRRAGAEDLSRHDENLRDGPRALEVARERVTARALPMRLLLAEYALDRTQVTIYFSAESWVDFRELVKDLAAVLGVRVRLHQVGARDAARLLGGIGPCGRELCCSSWLTEFAPISVKMAKEQSLFLNPTKFSGVCGKLMCCLRYEYDLYVERRDGVPAAGAAVVTPAGEGTVQERTRGGALVKLAGGEIREFPATDVRRKPIAGCSVLAGGSCIGGCGRPQLSDGET